MFFFIFSITYSHRAYAQNYPATYTPSSISFGESVTIEINDVPEEASRFRLDLGPAGNDDMLYPGLFPDSADLGDCKPKFDKPWTLVTCSNNGDGTLTITAVFNTGDINESETLINKSRPYAAYIIGGFQAGEGFTFNDADPVPFSIKSVYPNPAKEGQDVVITLADATVGNEYEVIFLDRPQGKIRCENPICKLNSFHVNFITNPNASVLVHDDTDDKILPVKIKFLTSDIGGKPACITCPSNSYYNTTAKLCFAKFGGYPVDPTKSEQCRKNYTCTQGEGCIKNNVPPENPYKNALRPTPPCAEELDNKENCPSVASALGNIKTDAGGFIKNLLGVILGIVGAITVLLIIRAGYKLMFSKGNPEKAQEAREELTSAIVGLLFIIFSLVILEVVGYDILRLPGLNK